MKRLTDILHYLLFAFIFLIMAAAVTVQLPVVQNWATDKALEWTEKAFDADIKVRDFRFKPFNTVIINGLEVVDRTPFRETARDTLFKTENLIIRFSPASFINPAHEGVVLKEVRLKNAQMNLVIENGEYTCNLVRLFRLKPKENPQPMPEADLVEIKRISIDDMSFSMQNFVSKLNDVPPTAINWSDMGVDDIVIRARDFRISHGIFYGQMDHMSFHERTGWDVKELQAKVAAGKGLVDIRDIRIYDGISDAELDFRMVGSSKDYADYIHKVRMEADIYRSRWSLEALSHFIPRLNPDFGTVVNLEGKYRGTVDDMFGDGLKLKFEDSSIGFTLDGGVSRLPDVDNMTFNVRLRDMEFTTDDICRAVNAIAPRAGMSLGTLGKGMHYSGNATVRGPINDMSANIRLSQGRDRGSVQVVGRVKNVLKLKEPPIRVKGSVTTDNLDINSILGKEVGPENLSCSFLADATLPGPDNALDARIDSLEVTGVYFKGHNYNNIHGNASILGKDLTADIQARDSALDADITVWSDKYAYYSALLIRKADLQAMNIDKRDVSQISTNVYTRLDKDLDNLSGNARLSDIYLTNSNGSQKVDDISIEASAREDIYNLSVDSNIAYVYFNGNKHYFDATFEAYNTASILAYALPGVYLEQGSKGHLRIGEDRDITGYINSGRLAYNNNFIKDISASIGGTLDSLKADMTSSNIRIAGYEFNGDTIRANLADSTIALQLAFSNKGSEIENILRDGEFNAGIHLEGNNSYTVDILPSRFNYNNSEWEIPASTARIRGKDIDINNLTMRSGDKWLIFDGSTSDSSEEVLQVQIHNFDLSPLNKAIGNGGLDIAGRLDVTGSLYSPLEGKIPEMEFEAFADSLYISGTQMGNIHATALMDSRDRSLKVDMTEDIEGARPLKARGIYRPENKTIKITADMDRFPLGFTQALLPDVFEQVGGSISGTFMADGPLDRLDLSSSNGKIHDAMLKVAFTHVPYYVNGGFRMDNNGITFSAPATVRDSYDGRGTAVGGLIWNRLKDMKLDLHMNVENMEATDIPASEPGAFYGNMFATGKVGLAGPFNSITLDVDARTARKSDIHIVIFGAMNATKGNLLTFKDPYVQEADPYDEILGKFSRKGSGNSNFKIRMHAVADPNTLTAALDMGSGGFAADMQGVGNGTIDIAIDSSPSTFNILGDYNLTEGSFNVNASNLVKREFNIREGSSIKFGGDIMESVVDLDAIYQTKASIASLIADTTSVSNRRQVNCGIHIQNKLSNPDINFTIDIPDLDPSVKSRVESALSTNDKIQKQFLSLLLSNNFLPDEQSGIVNNNSLLYSNVSEIMANQVNNIFTKLDIPLDLGLNYQPSDKGGTDLFDVALSTQLFNNRVIIGGTLGNRQKVTSSSQTLFGDLDIQYKVERSGALRLTLFSHSVDQYTNALDDAQRNGIGVTWQQEFDRLPDWVKHLFSDKARREVLEALEAEENKKTKTIVLDE